MTRFDSPEWLSAAECASRIGLTVRALRVYEECGLIAPGGAPAVGGYMGAHDLAKLAFA